MLRQRGDQAAAAFKGEEPGLKQSGGWYPVKKHFLIRNSFLLTLFIVLSLLCPLKPSRDVFFILTGIYHSL